MYSDKQDPENVMNLTTMISLTNMSWEIEDNATAQPEVGFYQYNIFKWHGAEMLVLIAIFIAGTVGNSLVLYIYHVRWRKSNFTFFVKILAAMDLFNCAVSVPLFFVMTIDGRNQAFEPLCKTTSFVAMSNTVSSGVVLAIVAFDRNQKIHRPLQHEIKHKTTQRLGVAAVILGLGMSAPGILLFGLKKTQYTENGVDFNVTWCFFADDKLGTTLLFSYVGALSSIFMIIFAAMAVFYFSIWRTLRLHLKSESLGCLRSSVAMTKNSNYYKSQKTSAKLFFIITVAFFSAYFPYYISVAVFLLDDYSHNLTLVGKSFADVAKLAPMASCAVNPLIYSISSVRFRREITQIFTRPGLPSDANRNKVLCNTMNSKERAQLNPKHSKSHSGSSFGLKVIANAQPVFSKNCVMANNKQAYS